LVTSPRKNLLTHKLQGREREYEDVDDPEKYGKSKLEESWGLMPDVEEEKKKP
jgi:hypothetical protein